jgi:hypothetical protein
MEIFNNGASITFEPDEIEQFHDLLCVCGHTLSRHASFIQWYYPDAYHHTGYQSQCLACGFTEDNKDFVCEKFRME